MDENRFSYKQHYNAPLAIGEAFDGNKRLTVKEMVDCLNEQQATIFDLKEENDILKQKLRKNYIANKQYEEMKRLQKENEQLKQEVFMYKKAFQEQVQRCIL